MASSAKKHKRTYASLLRGLKLTVLALAVTMSGYGIYRWTAHIEAQSQQRMLLEAQKIIEQRKAAQELPLERSVPLEQMYISSFPLRGPESYVGRELPAIGDTASPVSHAGEFSEYTRDEQENILIYEKYNKAVVNITTESYRLNFFLEPVPESDTGSGTIIDQQGHILTNYHVVQGAERVYVTLHDGTVFEGDIIGKDRESDLAVVKIDPRGKELTVIEFAVNPNLKVGQKVLAIGNPFGYDRTLTTGIISGVGRPIRTQDNLILTDMIQTDASINPGNSGGPLLNANGKMIGLNTSIYSPTGGSVGIGFAVPIDKVSRVVSQLIEHGQVLRGWIDIVPVQLDGMIVDYASLPVSQGILVSQVVSGGLAEQAGLRGGTEAVRYGTSIIYLGGDIIVEVAGKKISDFADLFGALEQKKPGEVVDVVIIRDRRMRSVKVELIQRPVQFLW